MKSKWMLDDDVHRIVSNINMQVSANKEKTCGTVVRQPKKPKGPASLMETNTNYQTHTKPISLLKFYFWNVEHLSTRIQVREQGRTPVHQMLQCLKGILCHSLGKRGHNIVKVFSTGIFVCVKIGEKKRGIADVEKKRRTEHAAWAMTAATGEQMPDSGGHFLLHWRLLWNSGRVHHVTMEGREFAAQISFPPLTYPFPSTFSDTKQSQDIQGTANSMTDKGLASERTYFLFGCCFGQSFLTFRQ